MRVVVVCLWGCCHLLPHPCGNAFGMRVVVVSLWGCCYLLPHPCGNAFGMRIVVQCLWGCCHLLPHPCGNAFGMRIVVLVVVDWLSSSGFALLVLVAVFVWLCLAGVGCGFRLALPCLCCSCMATASLLYGNRFPPKSGQSAVASSWGECCEGDCCTAVQAGVIWLAGSRVVNVVRVGCSTPMLKF